jgi:hypothetical protein
MQVKKSKRKRKVFKCLTTLQLLRLYSAAGRWKKGENGAMVKSFCQEKMDVRGDKLILVPICPPQTPHGLIQYETRASAIPGK